MLFRSLSEGLTRASNDSRGEDDLLRGVDGVRGPVHGVLERDAGGGGAVKDDLGGVETSENDEVGATGSRVEVAGLAVRPRPRLSTQVSSRSTQDSFLVQMDR